MNLYGWYEIGFIDKIENITILNKFLILKYFFYLNFKF